MFNLRRTNMSYQSITIVGYVGKDAEMRYTPQGQNVTSFSVATDRKYTSSSGEQVDETTWFKITAWGKLAETCNNYVKKGRLVLIEGRLIVDPKTGGPKIWQGQNGPGASFEINANTVKFLGGRGEGGGFHGGEPQGPSEGIDNPPPF
jgi:single-strand DNA-binding protein